MQLGVRGRREPARVDGRAGGHQGAYAEAAERVENGLKSLHLPVIVLSAQADEDEGLSGAGLARHYRASLPDGPRVDHVVGKSLVARRIQLPKSGNQNQIRGRPQPEGTMAL